MYFHVILKDKQTFDTIDYEYVTSAVVSGTNYVITYYDDATLTTPHTGTHVFANYYIYVIPAE